ncbi:type IV secretion system protein [Polynucleobacter sp. 86C-FISCH]|uniref:type IV secretion system protein n=1 Tax=Polynucleobacter sp. 86C-FISCH TaxID=2689101 RepID=UPI001C0B0248|nr:type IV secretion system protein [Polynucleobacter sp. 86C-FISCH]MBU3595070.1 type IV secretion system protein [Polynucleobacter sp. 86C-FISCH]
MKNKIQATLAFFILIGLSTNVMAIGLLDGILQTYVGATAGWMKVAQGYAFLIFAGLSPLSLSFWAVQSLIFEGLDISALVGKLIIKIFWLAFFFTIIGLAPTWVPQVTDTFMVMGRGFAGASGTVVTSPSQMMGLGVDLADAMLGVWKNLASGSITSIGNDIILGFGLVIAAMCALAGFAIIALQLLLTQVELAIIAPIGVVMLGFFGSPATKSIAEKYPSYLISIGVKLMFIFAMASLGPKISDVAIASIQTLTATSDQRPAGVLGLSFSILIYGILCLQIPAMASGMLSGSVSTSLGGIAGAGMAAGGAVAGAAMAAGGAAMGASAGGKAALERLTQLTSIPGTTSGVDSMSGLSSLTSPSNTPGTGLGPDSIGGAPSAPNQSRSASTFGSGMDRLNQGLGGMASHEGQTGAGVDINSGNHGG